MANCRSPLPLIHLGDAIRGNQQTPMKPVSAVAGIHFDNQISSTHYACETRK